MNTRLSQVVGAALILLFFTVLSGCGDNPETTPQTTDSYVPAPPAEPVLSPLDPKYEATLVQGIDFKKPGYPAFLAEVSGMSGQENWGRWTDAAAGPAAKFRFKQPLPQKFTLEVTAEAFGPNQGQAIVVRVGSVEKTFVFPKGRSTPDTYSLIFESTNGADTLEIVPPRPTSPAELFVSKDPRKLGVGLRSLKILG